MLSREAVKWAIDRLVEFESVHPESDLLDPVRIMTSAYLDPEGLHDLGLWCLTQDINPDQILPIQFGFLLGAIASEYE